VIKKLMKIALFADAPHYVNGFVLDLVQERGCDVVLLGAFEKEEEVSWATGALEAGRLVEEGVCDEAIVICWSGTGVTMAANKVHSVRAALCTDAPTAKAARIWNHANVLGLSHRLLTPDLASEILEAWFDTPMDMRGLEGVRALQMGSCEG